ncbi:multidrug ABC transporter permease [Lactobacillus xylocopicola]|uniref:multidrug ABC transporter permease n=1 Tax=Lactobacillus xylocopicola TaxID=2976676 RepID=UPI0029545D13|nr:multidrug ABC transporter permease [Lactobacillus xylocopicola]
MRFIRLFLFHLHDYLSDQYFVWLTITSTIGIFLLQYTIAYANKDLSNTMLWRQSGSFGMWTSCTTVAGCISFERYKGTLPYLMNSQYDERASLITLLLPASSYGLFSFPIAFILAKVLGVSTGTLTINMLLIIFLMWVACSVMGILIAAFLTLSPNAITYEALIGTPILLLAGLFGSSTLLAPLTRVSQWFIPLTAPIATLIHRVPFNWPAYSCSLFLWIWLTAILVKKINYLVRKKGALKII